MTIVVTTPTGHIGSALTEILLDKGERPTLIAREKSKVAHFEKRGAKVVQGSHGDARTAIEATQGADAFFVLIPPDFGSTNLRSHYRSFGNAAAAAIRENRIPHVVHLSSVGADLESGTGPVLGLHDTEAILAEAATNIIQLRPGYFMENTLGQLGAIKGGGQMYTTFKGDTLIPMVATRDIAARAADLLIDRSWKGRRVVEVQGPSEISYDQVAAALTEALGRPVRHVTVSNEQAKHALMEMGLSSHLGDLFNELAASIEAGRVAFREPKNGSNAGPTAYRAFANEVFRAAYGAT